MEELNNMLKVFIADKKSAFSVFLKGVEALKTFSIGDSTDLKPILTYMRGHTTLPNVHDFRVLLVMKLFIAQCSSQVFAETSQQLSVNLINIVRLNPDEKMVSLAAEILTDMLPFIVQNSDLSRQFAASSLATLVSSLVEKKTVPVLKCLEQCMVCFRGPCRQQRVEIENCILSSLASQDPEVLKVAGKLLVQMAGLGGGGEHGTYHTSSWLDYCHLILVSLHSVMMQLFAKAEANQDLSWKPTRRIKLAIPPIDKKYRAQQLCSRFEALCHCLAQMISTPFPAVVTIPVGDILGFICRVAAIKPDVLIKKKKRTNDDLVLTGLFPSVHIAALNVMQALILSCRRSLIPHSTTLSKVLLQYLQCTKLSQQYRKLTERPLSDLRIKIYDVLQVWIQVMTTASTLEKFHSRLVEHLLVDIQNPVETVKLQGISNGDMKNCDRPPKKRKLDAVHTLTSSSSLGVCKEDNQANSELCAASVKAFKTYVYAIGPLLHVTSYVSACQTVVRLVRDIQQQFLHLPSPYDDPLCRRELYSLLLAFTITSPPAARLPLSIARTFFSRGLQDPSVLVSSFCLEAEAVTTALSHPGIPSLELPICTPAVINESDPSAASLNIQHTFWNVEEPSDIPPSPERSLSDAETNPLDQDSNLVDMTEAEHQKRPRLEELDKSLESVEKTRTPVDKPPSPQKMASCTQEGSGKVVSVAHKDNPNQNEKEVEESEECEQVISGVVEDKLPSPSPSRSDTVSAEAGPSRIETQFTQDETVKDIASKAGATSEDTLDDMLQTFDDRDSDDHD